MNDLPEITILTPVFERLEETIEYKNQYLLSL